MENLWTKFLQWLCPHKLFEYKLIMHGASKGSLPMIESRKVCEDCGKILESCVAVDWGVKL